MNFRGFMKLSIGERFATVAAALSIAGGTSAAALWILSTDTVQKIHVKYKLLSLKVAKPVHLDQVNIN